MSGRKEHPLDLPLQPKKPLEKPPQSRKEEELQRLELLKRQKESERHEKEQALWREASRIPAGTETPGRPLSSKEGEPPMRVKPLTGLFAKLKLGKFLE